MRRWSRNGLRINRVALIAVPSLRVSLCYHFPFASTAIRFTSRSPPFVWFFPLAMSCLHPMLLAAWVTVTTWKSLPGLRWSRDRPDLLHQTHLVKDSPLFCDLTVRDTDDHGR
jgi:hypothetical protein